MTLQTVTFAREINLAKKPEPIYQSLDWKPWSRFQKPDLAENYFCFENWLCQMKTLACQNFDQNPRSRF
jgi:hypothetical protein